MLFVATNLAHSSDWTLVKKAPRASRVLYELIRSSASTPASSACLSVEDRFDEDG